MPVSWPHARNPELHREVPKAFHEALISRAEGAPVSAGTIVGAALGAGVGAFLVLGFGVWFWMRRRNRQPRGLISIGAKGHAQSSNERGIQPLSSTASLSGEVLSGRSGRQGQRGLDESTPSISKIRQHEFEPKPKRVQHEAKHARRSVLRRATQEEHSEESQAYSARQNHPNTFELAGWHGGQDAGSVNVRAWTAGVAVRFHISACRKR